MLHLLSGLRIVEVGAVVLAPYATQILADLGADVVKVEPLDGDIARAAHPRGSRGGALFVNANRNKRAAAIDLKAPAGRAAMTALIRTADVLIHNMRIDAADRLGLGFDAIAAINPGIVHCAATGFGAGGRYRDRPAFDDVIQAASGLAGLAALAGDAPRFAPTIVADKVAGLHVVYGVLAALLARERGQAGPFRVEVPMFEAMVAFLMSEHLAAATFSADGAPGYARVLSPDRRPYRTADGWIAAMPYSTAQWRRCLTAIGRDDLAAADWVADSVARQARVGELYGVLADALPARTTGAWLAAFEAGDIPCAPVAMPADLIHDPHLADLDFFAVPPSYPADIVRATPLPVRFGCRSTQPDRAAPRLGEHTRAVLGEAGLSEAEIAALIAAGIAVQAAS